MTKTLLCIDIGGGNLRIFDKNLGLVYNEPALIAVEKKGKKYVVLETGQKALTYKNLTKDNILVFSPIHEGIIQSPEYAATLLKHALEGLYASSKLLNSPAFIAVPSALSKKEKKAFIKSLSLAGLKNIKIVDCPVCTMLAQEEVFEDENILAIDLGATKCDFQILKNFQPQKSATLGLGGNSIKKAIAQTFWNDNNIYITDQTAQNLQEEFASLFSSDKKTVEISGIYTVNGEQITKNISSEEISPIIKGFFAEVVLIANTLIKEFNQDFGEKVSKVLLSGGLCHTKGLEKYLRRNLLCQNIIIDQDPENAVLRGLAKLLD
ncbi:MAG: rod shape-determining protein [Clostridia bacterium]|nr:rod shape-determining protein [Clostridia bacterium]